MTAPLPLPRSFGVDRAEASAELAMLDVLHSQIGEALGLMEQTIKESDAEWTPKLEAATETAYGALWRLRAAEVGA